MKKIALMVTAAALAIFMAGCSSSSDSSSPSATASSSSSSSSSVDDDALMQTYLTSNKFYVDRANELLNAAFDGLSSGNYEACRQADLDMNDLYEMAKNLKGFPLQAQESYDYLIEYLRVTNMATTCLDLASYEPETKTGADYIDEAKSHIQESTAVLEKLTESIKSLKSNE